MLPPFQVRTAGVVKDQPYHSKPATREGDTMLTAFVKGRGYYVDNHTKIPIVEGMVGIVTPEKKGILKADPADPYFHYYCRFNGTYAVHLAKQILAQQGKMYFQFDKVNELAGILSQMGHIRRKELPRRMGRLEVLIAQALVILSYQQEDEAIHRLSEFTLRYYFQSHLTEPIDLEKIADFFRISKFALCRKVKELTGRTVLQIGEKIKIEWAKELLSIKTTDENITDVAKRVGYNDPLYFSRVFKKHTGISPRGWKRRLFDRGK